MDCNYSSLKIISVDFSPDFLFNSYPSWMLALDTGNRKQYSFGLVDQWCSYAQFHKKMFS